MWFLLSEPVPKEHIDHYNLLRLKLSYKAEGQSTGREEIHLKEVSAPFIPLYSLKLANIYHIY